MINYFECMPDPVHLPDDSDKARFNSGSYRPSFLFEPHTPSGRIWPHLVVAALFALAVTACHFL